MAEKSLKQLYDDLRRSAGFAVVAGSLDPQTLPPSDEEARVRALALVREALAAHVDAAFGESAAQHFARLSAMEARLGNHLLSIEDALGVGLRQIGQTEARLNELATRIEGLGETLGHAIAAAEGAVTTQAPLDGAALQSAVAPLMHELGTLRRHVIALEAAVHARSGDAGLPTSGVATSLPRALRAIDPAIDAVPEPEALGPWIAGIVAALLGGVLIGLYGSQAAAALSAFVQNLFG
jgi:hypothetical protein